MYKANKRMCEEVQQEMELHQCKLRNEDTTKMYKEVLNMEKRKGRQVMLTGRRKREMTSKREDENRGDMTQQPEIYLCCYWYMASAVTMPCSRNSEHSVMMTGLL